MSLQPPIKQREASGPEPATRPGPGHPCDQFTENRIRLDHLSLSVGSMADLQAAAELFDARGIAHGEVKPLELFGIAVLVFREPDNIQMELAVPLG